MRQGVVQGCVWLRFTLHARRAWERASMASFLTSMASSGALRNAKMSDTDITIARAKSGSLRLKLEETDAAYEYDTKHELQLAQLAKSRIAVMDAAAVKVKGRAIVTRGNVADLQEQLAMEAEVERVEVLRRCDILEAEREVKARQAIVRERQGDRHRNKSMHAKVIAMRARKQLYVDDSADKMQGIERKQERASTLARSRTEERLKVLKAQTEDRERRLVDGQAVRDNLAQGRLLFRERTRQRLNERSAHVDATRADMASAQAERDFAASEARKSTGEFGKSLSEGKLQMSASQHGRKCSLGGAPARLLRLLGARLAALGGSALRVQTRQSGWADHWGRRVTGRPAASSAARASRLFGRRDSTAAGYPCRHDGLPLCRLRLHHHPDLPLGPDRIPHVLHLAQRCAAGARTHAAARGAGAAKVLQPCRPRRLLRATCLCREDRRQGASPLPAACRIERHRAHFQPQLARARHLWRRDRRGRGDYDVAQVNILV